ncbi:MAG: hypothetical protein HY925_02445 [Elusimicrobia bacterium]|nr:hypothetical protein [Elusimicrobiota bacterium]
MKRAFFAVLLLSACTEPPRGGNKGTPFEELTLQSLVRWPDGREYVTVIGRGYPEEGQTNVDARRRASRDGAAMAAQEKMIAELKKLAPKERIRDLLRQVEIAKTDYTYDDICSLTLRLPKELLGEKKQVWNDER